MAEVNELLAVGRSAAFELGTENRFPLVLTSTKSAIWEAYESALTEVWDPEDETHWADLDPASFTAAQRQAAALVWSHRAWVDHAAMAESEAVLVRACLEPAVSVDFKYCVGMRAVERARSVDACYMAAAKLDRYHAAPASSELMRLLNDDLLRRALHARTHLGAYVAAHLVAQATIDLRAWERVSRPLPSGLAALAGLVVRDKARMLDVGWVQLGEMAEAADERTLAEMAATTAYVLYREEGRGRQLPALLTPGGENEAIVAAYEVAAEAGLGGLTSTTQREVFDVATTEVTTAMAGYGIDVPGRPVDRP